MAVTVDLRGWSRLAGCCGVVLATLVACGGDDEEASLPACEELAGHPVDDVDGCVTPTGRGLQSYEYECSDGKVAGVTIILSDAADVPLTEGSVNDTKAKA